MEDQASQATGLVNNLMLGAGAVGLSLWGLYERIVRLRVEKAGNKAEVAMSEGQERLFALMSQRLESLEKEVASLREALETERRHRRDTELYVFRLQDAMAAKGLEVPPFAGDING